MELRSTRWNRVHWNRWLLIALGATAVAQADDLDYAKFADRQQRLAAIGGKSEALAARIFNGDFEPVQASGCSVDSDGDRLPDCAETATGVFVSAADTGTSPSVADTDGDAIADGDEVLGTAAGLDLPGLGANPLRRDLLVEFDWFDDQNECAPHSHRPSAAALNRLSAMFAAAPVANSDGSTGIHLILDAGQGGLRNGGNRVDGHDPVLPGGFDATYGAIKSANFAQNRRGYFHYVLMAHRYAGGLSSSGYAEVVGDDLIVSLYCYHDQEDYVTWTIGHELGHNLGLHHGGFEGCNNKPNYNSLMNYRFQFRGTDRECTAIGGSGEDFSIGDRIPIDERTIDERAGVCGQPAIDWNTDGTLQNALAYDLNPDDGHACGGALSTLRDFDDWAAVTLIGIRDARDNALKAFQQEVGCAGAPPPAPPP